MKYDVEAYWPITRRCFVGCYYCPVPERQRRSPTKILASPAQWLEALDKTEKVWHLIISGGEPFLYPYFEEFIQTISFNHVVTIETSLRRPVDKFLRRLSTANIPMINASLHPEVNSDNDRFAYRVRRLRRAGFTVLPSVIMTPSILKRYDDLVDSMMDRNVFPVPRIMYGSAGGKEYPGAYTEEEREKITSYITEATTYYKSYYWGEEKPTIWPFLGIDHWFDDYYGSLCLAGSKFLRIEPDGFVYPCHESQPTLGSIFDPDFELMDEPTRCEVTFNCRDFCRRYSALPGRFEEVVE